MRFTCSTCGEVHHGLPDVSFDAPIYYYQIPKDDRERLATLSSDLCVIENRDFFVRGVLEIPIRGTAEAFGWGVWASLSQKHFERYVEIFEADPPPSGEGPWFGWLSNRLPNYPDTLNLKTRVHLLSGRRRPFIELEPTDHPLAVHQRAGIEMEALLKIIDEHLHPGGRNNN